ncbi:hypothetical protein MKZ38_001302 [Zalerion maritima]|uniref:Uncharacterized protein n=1 Tax=Zalerion maritima TaxID=339359 RepID=A0AAD5WRK3_9PEZI|nr:hypothetical protein MKZ38_001302 [Zalerion maritima]
MAGDDQKAILAQAALADLGLDRVEDLYLDNTIKNGPTPTYRSSVEADKPLETTAIGQSFRGMSFAQMEMEATKNGGLEDIAGGGLYRRRDAKSKPHFVQNACQPIKRQYTTPGPKSGYARRLPVFDSNKNQVGSLGGVLPKGAQVKVFLSSRAPSSVRSPSFSELGKFSNRVRMTETEIPASVPVDELQGATELFKAPVTFCLIPHPDSGFITVVLQLNGDTLMRVFLSTVTHIFNMKYVCVKAFKGCDVLTEVVISPYDPNPSKSTLGLRFKEEKDAKDFFVLVRDNFPGNIRLIAPQEPLISIDEDTQQEEPLQLPDVSEASKSDLAGLAIAPSDQALFTDHDEDPVIDLDAAVSELVAMYERIIQQWKAATDNFDFLEAVTVTTQVVSDTHVLGDFMDDQKVEIITRTLGVLAASEEALPSSDTPSTCSFHSIIDLKASRHSETATELDLTRARKHGVVKEVPVLPITHSMEDDGAPGSPSAQSFPVGVGAQPTFSTQRGDHPQGTVTHRPSITTQVIAQSEPAIEGTERPQPSSRFTGATAASMNNAVGLSGSIFANPAATQPRTFQDRPVQAPSALVELGTNESGVENAVGISGGRMNLGLAGSRFASTAQAGKYAGQFTGY